MRKLNQFDGIAWVYDSLARVAFLGRIRKAQCYFLKRIPNEGDVLILGGGTGWILEELLRLRPAVKICYVEASQKMIEKARSYGKGHDVLFIHGTEFGIPDGKRYDVIITNFYFDLFRNVELPGIVDRVQSFLKPEGLWLVSEFCSDRRWMRTYLKLMYSFFRLTCGLTNYGLPMWRKRLHDAQFKAVAQQRFFGGFIDSSVFCRT